MPLTPRLLSSYHLTEAFIFLAIVIETSDGSQLYDTHLTLIKHLKLLLEITPNLKKMTVDLFLFDNKLPKMKE